MSRILNEIGDSMNYPRTILLRSVVYALPVIYSRYDGINHGIVHQIPSDETVSAPPVPVQNQYVPDYSRPHYHRDSNQYAGKRTVRLDDISYVLIPSSLQNLVRYAPFIYGLEIQSPLRLDVLPSGKIPSRHVVQYTHIHYVLYGSLPSSCL